MIEQKPFLDVVGILKEVGIKKGAYIGDLGCGTGYFTFPAAKMVGPTGRVFSIDVQKHIMKNIQSRAQLEGTDNVIPVWTDLEIVGAAKRVENESLDFAFLVNIFFQTKKDKEVMKEAMRMTKTGGKIIVVDWKKKVTPFGPVLENRLEPKDIEAIAEELGLEYEEEFEAGIYHWGLIFSK